MKQHRRVFYLIAGMLLLTGFYFLLRHTYPKNASYFPVLVVLIILDIYLWKSILNLFKRPGAFLRWILSVVYWLPLVILVISTFLSLFIDLNDPATPLKIYVMGFVFMMYASKIVPAVCMIIADLLYGLIRLFRRLFSTTREKVRKQTAGIKIIRYTGLSLGFVMMVLLTLGMAKWAYDFQIRRYQIDLPNLPERFDGLHIVQISDLHLGSWSSKNKLKEAIELVNGLNPDLVFFTGDLVNYTTNEALPFEPLLREIHASIGIIAVLGNHDYGDYATWPTPEDKEANMIMLYGLFERLGWKLLQNSHEVIDLFGDRIAVVGVENWSVYERFQKRGDLELAMKGILDVPVILLLSHDPSHWGKEVITGFPEIDVTFSGHTHGFQFGMESGNCEWSPVQWLYDRWIGMYMFVQPDGRMQYLYVNRGLGTIGYPGRVGVLPEITLFELGK